MVNNNPNVQTMTFNSFARHLPASLCHMSWFLYRMRDTNQTMNQHKRKQQNIEREKRGKKKKKHSEKMLILTPLRPDQNHHANLVLHFIIIVLIHLW